MLTVENHIFKHNWIFRHFCIYKQPTLTKQWNFNVFVQILCSYFRYTGRLFFGYAPFVPHRNTIRISWETKKERLSYRKTCIEEFVWGISLFWLHAFLSMSFCCFLLLLSPPSQVRHLRNGCYKDTHIAMSGILFVDIMSKRSKTWKSIIEYYKLFFNSPSGGLAPPLCPPFSYGPVLSLWGCNNGNLWGTMIHVFVAFFPCWNKELECRQMKAEVRIHLLQ